VQRRARFATVVFDVDSTLAAIEGIDWLAEQRGPEIARACADLTARAMSGEMPIEAVYLERLQAIAPTAAEIEVLAEAYRAAVVPGAEALIAYSRMHSARWRRTAGSRAAIGAIGDCGRGGTPSTSRPTSRPLRLLDGAQPRQRNRARR
jgi:hypothetical protein